MLRCFLDDSNLQEDFYKYGVSAANSLRTKYYTVSENHSPEDIVQYVACKVIKQHIQFQQDKRNFRGFVFMLIKNKYIDLSRRLKDKSAISLEREIDDEGGLTIEDMIACPGVSPEDEVLGDIGFNNIIDSLPNSGDKVAETPMGILNLSVKNLVLLKYKGYSTKEMAEMFGVTSGNINSIIREGKRLIASCF
jgi:RNA polymerase sigma factor (sigma-70 family)